MKLSKEEFLNIIKNKVETFADLWEKCERADWMIEILSEMAGQKGWPDHETVVLCACDCAETAMKFVPEDEHRPKIAIQTARNWITGKATFSKINKVSSLSYAKGGEEYEKPASAAAYCAAAYAADPELFKTTMKFFRTNSCKEAAEAFVDAGLSKKEAMKNMADIIRKRVIF
jgi:hypothetical protein